MAWYYEMLAVGGWSLVLWFLQNIIHEESHAGAGYLFGWRVDERYWWFNRRERDGKRFSARVTWENPVKKISDMKQSLIRIAPLITNSLIISTLAILLIFVEMWDHLTYPLIALMLLNLADGGNNCRIALTVKEEDFGVSGGDLVRFARRADVSLGVVRAISGSWVAISAVLFTLALIFRAG
jgi:hypothetical protein